MAAPISVLFAGQAQWKKFATFEQAVSPFFRRKADCYPSTRVRKGFLMEILAPSTGSVAMIPGFNWQRNLEILDQQGCGFRSIPGHTTPCSWKASKVKRMATLYMAVNRSQGTSTSPKEKGANASPNSYIAGCGVRKLEPIPE